MSKQIDKATGSQWTDEQWQAISARGQNILVAAAAGSGKTAVLVERIIRRIADEENPIDVDRLLVATFTKAAASEMKGRIRDALEKELQNKPYSLHLRRQLLLLTRASISTLHSFCMEVVKRHSYLLDLDPAFRVADELEAKLLRQDIIDTVFEEEYQVAAQGVGHFFTLVDWYGSDRSDTPLQTLVQRLYDFAQSHPWPEHWLEEMLSMYAVDANSDFEQLPWIKEMRTSIHLDLMGAIDELRTAIKLAQLPQGPEPYIDNLTEELRQFEDAFALSNGTWSQLQQAVLGIQFGRLKSCRGEQYDAALKEKVKELRDQAKKKHETMVTNYFAQSPEDILAELSRMHPVMQALVSLVKKFGERYQIAKQEKGFVDFADLEHYCLQILRHPDSTPIHLLPSEVAESYQEQFAEILVDEYQDTNMVQESILALIARPGETGNRFMVGDVKQSIYRFRLTEPKLFMEKYEQYSAAGNEAGLRIDLSKNFRSRREVLLGTNYVFRQIMRKDVAELDYDPQAELIPGADYPELEHNPIEIQLIDRNLSESRADTDEEASEAAFEESNRSNEAGFEDVDPEELENAELEARWIATRIHEMITGSSTADGKPYQVYDRTLRQMRNIQYRDIVILLRSTNRAAPLMLEEFRVQGIPAYAEVSGGYFAATEIEIMLSLLRIIDNPYQDIPLAAVLRSPIVQLSAEEMAQLRLIQPEGHYYDALLACKQADMLVLEPEVQSRLQQFCTRLEQWREEARQGALSELIWRIYQETAYYDFAGSLAGGRERQANLRALYDRARQFEQSAFRGLYRFLRFVERMQERGEEMGVARALGEQEDVVRIMTIHKSKGLEFPVVFIASLAKQFNMQDQRGAFLYHKELGFGSKWVDTEQRITYPTLPQLAIRKRQMMELLAEEQRLLYVAMTRAKEKLILVGTVRNLEQRISAWSAVLEVSDWQLPPHIIATTKTYLDWIGYALVRHPAAKLLLKMVEQTAEQIYEANNRAISAAHMDISSWTIQVTKADRIIQSKSVLEAIDQEMDAAIREGRAIAGITDINPEIVRRLQWQYPFPLAQLHLAKQSVSEIKRKWQAVEGEGEVYVRTSITERPRFMEAKGFTAAERGSAMHMVMQQLDMKAVLTIESIHNQVQSMVERELLTQEQADVIDVEAIERFFAGAIGQRLLHAKQIVRELPFSYMLPAREVYKDSWKTQSEEDEHVLIQGIIDVLVEEEDGWFLLDYKTDRTTDIADEELTARYQVQIDLYSRAIEAIWKRPLKEKILYFFDGQRVIRM